MLRTGRVERGARPFLRASSSNPHPTLPSLFPLHPQPLSQVLRVLDTHHILSAPVFAAGSSRFAGFISVGDILRAVLAWAALMDDPSPAGRVENLHRAGARLETTRVRDIARTNDGSLLLAAAEGVTLLDVVRDGLLKGGGAGVPACHRVGVYDFACTGCGGVGDEDDDPSPSAAGLPGETGPAFTDAAGAPLPPGADPSEKRVIGIISQSDVIRFLFRAAALPTAPVSSLPGLVTSPVVSVSSDMPAALAFASLFSSEGVVSAAAVLESRGPDAGTLVGTLSTADLRGMRPDGLAALATPTLAYLSTRPARPNIHGAKTEADLCSAAPPATSPAAWGVKAPDVGPGTHPLRVEVVSPAAPFGEVVARLAASGAHRAYVCTEDGRPEGVITLTDILRVVAAGG